MLTTRQNTKLRNAINNNLATDIKLSKTQIKKLIQSEGFLDKLLSKLAGPLMKVAVPLAKSTENETKEPRGRFLSMLLGTLGASLLGNLLIGLNSLLPFHPLTNIEINEYYKNEPRFSGAYSRNSLPH